MKSKLIMAVSSLITLTLGLFTAKAKADQQNNYQPNGTEAAKASAKDVVGLEEDELMYQEMMETIDPRNLNISDDDGTMRHNT